MKPDRQRAIWLACGALVAAGATLSALAGGQDSGDGWNKEQRATLASLQLKGWSPAPRDPSNAVESAPLAVELGKRLFFDPRFSRNGRVSCATCHDPRQQFQDGRPLGLGVGTGSRRTMPVMGATHSPWLFWDGRKDSMWAQALGPLEDGVEHGGNRLQYAHLLQTHYRAEYEALFHPMPALARLPADASPLGTQAEQAAWAGMEPAARVAVSHIFANMGKAIAAYEKTLHYGPSRLDRYIDALLHDDPSAPQLLTAQEKNGLRIYIGKAECITCHNGPMLTDLHFHNNGIAPRDPVRPDHGRAAAVGKVIRDEFNCLGRYSDAGPDDCQELRFIATADPQSEGAFKTPSLRNVALRAPYMHAGQIDTLPEVVRHYVRAPAALVGHTERKPVKLSEDEIRDLVAMLATLSGPVLEYSSK